jgi:cyclopropane-fatty-acyl-phospholipid synthase
VPALANEQHYEVPAAFFEHVLGRHLKYSCGWWGEGETELDAAEEAMLGLSCEHAEMADGLDVLDLGCGWGSLSLWLAERYPRSSVTAVSNSTSQRLHIEARAHERGLSNLRVLTCDVNNFAPSRRFDRVMSIEMFEHVRNHRLLLERIADWLRPQGRLFVHHFCHREYMYAYEDAGATDWMSRHFFSGGMMPSHDMLLHHQHALSVEDHWVIRGTHYQQTSDAWLSRLDENRHAVLRVLMKGYGGDAERWLQRWRMFFMACSELFGFRDGNEWWVAHYRMVKR